MWDPYCWHLCSGNGTPSTPHSPWGVPADRESYGSLRTAQHLMSPWRITRTRARLGRGVPPCHHPPRSHTLPAASKNGIFCPRPSDFTEGSIWVPASRGAPERRAGIAASHRPVPISQRKPQGEAAASSLRPAQETAAQPFCSHCKKKKQQRKEKRGKSPPPSQRCRIPRGAALTGRG